METDASGSEVGVISIEPWSAQPNEYITLNTDSESFFSLGIKHLQLLGFLFLRSERLFWKILFGLGCGYCFDTAVKSASTLNAEELPNRNVFLRKEKKQGFAT